MTHAVRYNDDVVQTLDFASLEQLRYLAQLLGHCTFNMYPREPRPRPEFEPRAKQRTSRMAVAHVSARFSRA